MDTVLVRSVPKAALVGLLKMTLKVLVPSTKPLFKIGTTMVWLVSPAAKVSVPLVEESRSEPDIGQSLAGRHCPTMR